MALKVFEIDLDIKDPRIKSVDAFEVVSGDTDTNIFNVQLFENFVPVNASGNTVVIIFGKPDRTTVFQNLTVVDATKGQYTCTLSSQTIAVPGRIKAEVALYEGIKRLTSTRFEFIVRKALLNENTVESSNEFSALTEALSTVNQYDNRITDLAGTGRTTETVKGNADAHNTHEAETVSRVVYATRDLSITGDQVISFTLPIAPKSIKVSGMVYGTKGHCEGKATGVSAQAVIHALADTGNWYVATSSVIRLASVSPSYQVDGKITAVSATSITINWAVTTGSVPAGTTAHLILELLTH